MDSKHKLLQRVAVFFVARQEFCDTFRFKCVVFSFRNAVDFVLAMHNDRTPADRSLCPDPHGGLSPQNVAKLDVAKLKTPKEWGWRFLAFDFVMPNRQIVECYIVFREMEDMKKNDDPHATVCPELSNHEIFEKWRVVDTPALSGDRLAEFERDREESNRRYDYAFQVVLSHTSSVELNAFWSIFGGEHHQHDHASVGAGTAGAGAVGAGRAPLFHTNPMTASAGAGAGSSPGTGSGTDWSAASVRDNTRSFDFGGSMGTGTDDVSMGMAYPEEMGGETNTSTVQAMENPMR
eukprot:g2848.t1